MSILVESFLFFGLVSIFPGVESSLSLTSYPDKATEGGKFTLSCTNNTKLPVVGWIRNGDAIFTTQFSHSNSSFELKSETFKYVSGRMNVSTSEMQHNVTIRINSTLDDGSVWKCRGQTDFSTNLTINVIKDASDALSSPPTTLSVSQEATSAKTSLSHMTVDVSKEIIYIVIGSAIGGIVAVVAIVVIVCVVKRRRRQKASTRDDIRMGQTIPHEKDGNINDSEMIENVLYSGYSDPPYSSVGGGESRSSMDNTSQMLDETRVTDVYAQVEKKKHGTEIQVTVNIDDLYARPKKKQERDATNVSIHNTVNVNIEKIDGRVEDEDA